MMNTSIKKEIKVFKSRAKYFIRNSVDLSKRRKKSTKYAEMMCNDYGYELLGSGGFGAVVGIGKNLVVKVVANSKSAPSYLAYAKYCKENYTSNSMLPKIYSIFTMDGFAFVVMEKLEEINNRKFKNSDVVCSTITDYFVSETSEDEEQYLEEAKRFLKFKKAAIMEMVAIKDTTMEIIRESKVRKGGRKSFLDVNDSNVMVRKTGAKFKLVVVDPIAY